MIPYTAYTLVAAIAACAAFAVWKGGWAERVGAGVNLLFAVFFLIAQRSLGPEGLSTATLVMDGLLALTFLALTVYFAKMWLGAAMFLQAAQFSLHAYYYVSERPHDLLFMMVNNLVSWGLLICITVGVIGVWRDRAKTRPALSSPAAAPR